MNRWLQNQRIAGVLGLIGGGLGVMVGLIQATFGTDIPNWTGHKAAPLPLGLLTVGLSVISVLAARQLQTRPGLPTGQRLVAALGLLIPGSLCFSTGGALWYVPGAILFTGGVYAVIGGEAHRTREVIATTWPLLLVSALGAFEVLMAVSAGSVMTAAVGVAGGVALMAAPWPQSARLRMALLIIGTVPFALLTWWSVASPLLAVVALAVGLTALRRPGYAGRPTAA